MGYREQLESLIRRSYAIIRDREEIVLTTSRPEERIESERAIDRQWSFIRTCLGRLLAVCHQQGVPIPEDVGELVSRFPDLSDIQSCTTGDSEIRQVYGELRQIIPSSEPALDQLSLILHDLAHQYEIISEWKELHNLLQEITTSLAPFVGELEVILDRTSPWSVASGRRLWRPTQLQLSKLEGFAKGLRYIGTPLRYAEGTWHGSEWALKLVMLRRDMETSLQEGDVSTVFDLSTNLLDACNMYLYIADKQLRDHIGELQSLTRGIVGSVMP